MTRYKEIKVKGKIIECPKCNAKVILRNNVLTEPIAYVDLEEPHKRKMIMFEMHLCENKK